MEAFRVHSGKVAVLPGDQIDTDRIIPARFLSRVSRLGYGELLFVDVRGADFALDQPEAAGASILVVGTNFGCGSSREHAVWAIQQAGYRAVIARKGDGTPGFSDIFRQNAANCGLLLIELAPEDHAALAAGGSGQEATIDLSGQTITFGTTVLAFNIDAATKHAIVEGLDLIGTTLLYSENIDQFEQRHNTFVSSSK
jgi:3-isopropylmalate/(R)-2-methylmalate dehydratase small subunit